MNIKPKKEARTLVDALRESFDRALRSPEGMVEPAALVWTDADGEWRELIPKLRAVFPQFYTLGSYNPSERTGPAIWLRCVVDRALPEVSPPAGVPPILYLPRVSRQVLRAAGDCPWALQPLVELQYRGCVWHQKNGRDWSVEAFLVSEEGLGLDIAKDTQTRDAMLRALPLLADTVVESLRGRRLDADDFDKLAVSDPVRDLLRWMSDPDVFRQSLNAARWESFRNVCKVQFDVDPDEDGTSSAAQHLAVGEGHWDDVWQRFCEAPRLYPGVSDLLRQPAAGQAKLALDPSRSPTVNEEAESRLKRDLEFTSALPHHDACEKIIALEAEHGVRRQWVWAQLDESPLAVALEPLSRLAKLAKSPIGGTSVGSMADSYAGDCWRCDAAVLDTLAISRSRSDATVISKVIRAVYLPWLDISTRRFQELVAQEGDHLRLLVRGSPTEKGTCLVFVDGLRFDLGGRLQETLDARGVRVQLTHRFAPLPTVTATAKPAATPVYSAVRSAGGSEDFMPVLTGNNLPAVASRLREEISKRDVQVLESDELPIPLGYEGGGWAELGRLDELGHKLGAGLAFQLVTEIDHIADRVITLLDAGWERVRIVTDHGWLLMPGGLPKFDLPNYLVETKWARCASVLGDSTPTVPIYSWHWDGQTRVASPPGVASFIKGVEYAHGGVSLQECVAPELVVERTAPAVTVSITGVHWRGMRCRVSVRTNDPTVRVDLRLNWKLAGTTIAAASKEVGLAGEVSLVVENDRHEGSSAMVVVIDRSGNVLDRLPTIVGESQ